MTATVADIQSATPSDGIRSSVEVVKDSYLQCGSSCRVPQADDYIANLMKRVRDGRVLLAGHELAIQYNAFTREAPQHRIEAPLHAQLAIVRSWFDAGPIDLKLLVRRETVAQGMADPAQWDLTNPTPKMLADADDALSVHLIELQRLVEGVRQLRYANRAAV